ncbi:MAG: fibronectin type III domain-containing protein, partial [Paludibacteraceae bacterium]|nr:fibronectin type III domain-containing protein [Paludibacteraceae bacterium]
IYSNNLDFWGLRGVSLLKGMLFTESASAYPTYQCSQHKYAPKATFTYTAPTPPATPTGLAVEPAATSASVTWNAVAAATSYKLQQSANGSSWSDLASPATNSYSWTGLTPETTYYVRVAATNANGDSDYSDAVSFTTDALHTHNAITFDKWTTTNNMPLSGNYYLADNVTITAAGLKAISGALNICLNGHTLAFTAASGGISVSSTGALSIYDHVGGGAITSPNGTATIQVADGGSVTIYEGSVTNSDDATKAIKTSANGALTLPFSENSDNSETYSLAANCGNTVNVNLARSWVADGYYSTLCLPFALSSAQVTSIFGTGTELAKLTSSSIEGEEITITFTSANSIEAGKPYIILPKENAVNPSINNITLSSSTTDATTTYVDFIGTLSPTYLAASEDILFLGANNAIGWPAAAGYLKGMRAYFQLHSLPAGAPALRHARLIAPGHSTPTALDEANENKNIQKRLENGQLIIIRDGKKYNVIGGQQ